jgi:hypothetical protein
MVRFFAGLGLFLWSTFLGGKEWERKLSPHSTPLDTPVIIGIVLTLSSLFILINLVVDFIYAQLDPQVKIQ